MKRSRAEVIAALEGEGLVFHTLEVETRSVASSADVEWNQFDVAHVAHVHPSFRTIAPSLGRDVAIEIFVQRLLGVRWPLTTAHYRVGPGAHVSVTSLLFFVVVLESRCVDDLPHGSRITATLSVGTRPWLRWLLPWAGRTLRRNHLRLAADDEPLRRRRAELRSWGYRFVQDQDPTGYEGSVQLARDNVLGPEPASDGQVADTLGTVDLNEGSRREWLLGRDDHLGLRVVRRDARLLVFPRLCRHDGASLDAAALEQDCLVCPWHGRRWQPLASFDLEDPSPRDQLTGCFVLSCDGATLEATRADRNA